MTQLFRVGYQIAPQNCTIQEIREAYLAAESLGVDVIYVWDLMHAFEGPEDGDTYAALPLLAAMAVETQRVQFGAMVHGNACRNPELLAYDVATMSHLSGGRAILGIGAGWFEDDYEDFGYEPKGAGDRLRDLAGALPRIKARLEKVVPQPPCRVPILIGGGSDRVTLKLAAEYADMWNTFPPVPRWTRKSAVLDEWCEKLGRDPSEIERSCLLEWDEYEMIDELLDAGCRQMVLEAHAPFDMSHLEGLLKLSGR